MLTKSACPLFVKVFNFENRYRATNPSKMNYLKTSSLISALALGAFYASADAAQLLGYYDFNDNSNPTLAADVIDCSPDAKFFDGALRANSSGAADLDLFSGEITIGSRLGGANSFNGMIDDFYWSTYGG